MLAATADPMVAAIVAQMRATKGAHLRLGSPIEEEFFMLSLSVEIIKIIKSHQI